MVNEAPYTGTMRAQDGGVVPFTVRVFTDGGVELRAQVDGHEIVERYRAESNLMP